MENFNEYWELFVDKRDSIAKEIIAYYKTLDDHEDGMELSDQCRSFFRKNMIQNPYPTCQLLKLLAMSKIPGKNSGIYELATAVAMDAFDADQQADCNKCYNILTNSLVSVKATNGLKTRIVQCLERKQIDLETLMLVVFSRKSLKLLVQLLPEMDAPLKQQLVSDALNRKQHFFGALLENKSTAVYAQHENYLRFVEHVLRANNGQGSFSPHVEGLSPLPADKSYLTMYLLEMQRCFALHRALRLDGDLLPAKDYSQHATVMSMLVRAKANLSEYDFATLLAVIRTNQTLIKQIVAPADDEPPEESSEAMMLHQVQTVIVLYRAIEASRENGGVSSSNFDAQMKCLMKETDMVTFMETMESVFTMLFVRAELLTEPSVVDGKHFLCSPSVLGSVASSMKSIMITRKHSAAFVDASEQTKARFQTLLELVTDVCWRLSLFDDRSPVEETSDGPGRDGPVQLTDMLPVPTTLTPVAENYCEQSSSTGGLYRSVESIAGSDGVNVPRHRFGAYGTLPKHKSSRRHARLPLTATGSSNSGGSNKDLQRQASLSVDARSESISLDREPDSNRTVLLGKKAFTKLFATPETLAIVCLTNSKMHFARQIIENHHLQDRPVGRLVQRIEQMQELKANLDALVKKNERRRESPAGFGGSQSSDTSSDILLDDIRSKTAVGFEISKILSTIETFLKSQTIRNSEASDGILAPMDRFVGRYPFLSVLTGTNLHLSQVVDIVLNLPFKYELNLAIYNFLLKNAQHMTTVMSASSTGYGGETSQLIGSYVSFFGTVIDTLQMALKTNRAKPSQALTIDRLLTREICPLSTVENGIVFKRRGRFHAMIERGRGLEHSDDLEGSFALLSDNSGSPGLAKMKLYLEHLMTLVQATGSEVPEDTKLHQLVRTDPEQLMLERLLTNQVSFHAMDAMAGKLGVNLGQFIGKRLLGCDNVNNPASLTFTGELWEFVSSKSKLLWHLAQTQNSASIQAAHETESLFVNVSTLVNGETHLGGLPIGCDRSSGLSVPLFPLELNRTCCLLRKRVTSERECLRDSEGLSVEERARALLANVNDFSKAGEWISASDHLLTSVPAVQDPPEPGISPETRAHLLQKASELRTYLRIGTILHLPPDAKDGDGWRAARKFSGDNTSTVLHQLIELSEYRVCADWIKLHPIDADRELEMFMYAMHRVTAASTAQTGPGTPMALLFAIIETMPTEAVVKLYETMMLNVRSVPVVSYMLQYLHRHVPEKPLHQKYRLTLKVFEHLSQDEYDGLWNLASRPLLIIEQCLMNSRLELLAGVMRSIRPLLVSEVCRHCYEHREYIRDLHDTVHQPAATVRRNPVHDGLFISHECVDCLLRVYAGKALEYNVFPDGVSRPLTDGSRVSSYDSLSEIGQPFVMPKDIPSRDRWVKDEDALHCMCCRRTFSMLNRRHHCRRCGRVVCHLCSKRKLQLEAFYEDVAVRVCDDCWRHLSEALSKASQHPETATSPLQARSPAGSDGPFEWQLTGNERYDDVIRDEYSYEYAPSTGQCLAICNLHTANEEIASFLLYHCAKLEALLRPLQPGCPNPEVDLALVARMLLNLTLGVKVRGGGTEVEKMKEHAEIILSIVHDNCEALLLHTSYMGNDGSLRKLRDALVKAEKWTLALELSLKCGFTLNGVMAAWGMTCLRAGCYETAREKFSHCLPRVATESECDAVLRMIEAAHGVNLAKVPVVKRPARCPPLLSEILYALAYTARSGAPSEVIVARVNAARLGAGAEPALNILGTLANLRNICQGTFEADTSGRSDDASIMCSRLFEESMHYLLAYGSHQSVVQFLARHRHTEMVALRYILAQQVDPDVFLQVVLLPHLQRGALETVVQRLSDIDDTLFEWRDYIRYACRYLETNEMLNSLYSLQLLMKDPIRASMTCVRFYTMGCRTFSDLHAAEHHLKTSVTHLQNELELCNWQEVRLNSTGSAVETHHSLLMKLDPKELNNHINTMLLQMDITKFLATCEAKGRQTINLLSKIFREASQLPTLFGSSHERLQLAILTLVCGQNVEEAFGLSYRIIQDYNLDMQRVYALTAKYFINHGKIEDVSKLLDVIVSNECSTEVSEPTVATICDEIVRVSVDVAINRHGSGVHTKVALELLINRVTSVAVRIHCYIASGQLKTAYLLANRHNRTGDIRKILRQAELLGQMHVKRLCEARLNHHDGTGAGTS